MSDTTLRGHPNPRDKRLSKHDLDLALNALAIQRNTSYGSVFIDALRVWCENRAQPGVDIWRDCGRPGTRQFEEGVHGKFYAANHRPVSGGIRQSYVDAAIEYLDYCGIKRAS